MTLSQWWRHRHPEHCAEDNSYSVFLRLDILAKDKKDTTQVRYELDYSFVQQMQNWSKLNGKTKL